MFQVNKIAVITALLLSVPLVQAQSNDFATGNMHMDVKAMDTNGDNMISKDEFMTYIDKMYGMMSKGADTISLSDAAQDFARGNMHQGSK